MTDNRTLLPHLIDEVMAADIRPLRNFLFSNPDKPLVVTGSGGSETAAELAALLYGASGGVATAVSPYTMHSLSDAALSTAKVLLISKGGHNRDAVFATRRSLEANPTGTAGFFLSAGDGNNARKLLLRTVPEHCFVTPVGHIHDGFVSVGTYVAYFALLTRIFQEDAPLQRYKSVPERPFSLQYNDGTPIGPEALRGVGHYIILHGSWGRPVALNLEGKLVECGLAGAGVYDYRNYCHGRFIYTSNHLEDSAIVMLVSPRERDISLRTRAFLPPTTKLVVVETGHDAPEATLDLLLRASDFFRELCTVCGTDPACPSNPGRIDKRVPINVPFISGMKEWGPLFLSTRVSGS